jgi:2OG-Fe(II) oxygenase superfamily
MFDKTNTYAFFDLTDMKILPGDWKEEVLKVADIDSYLVKLDEKSSTSREPENIENINIFVVEGDTIFKKLYWLYELYSNELLHIADSYFSQSYEISNDLRNGTNINYLKGKSARYEWHVDSNPLTGILFVTTHGEKDGGELIFQLKNEIVTVYPQEGMFILFDAREIPHTVNPLKKNSVRVSIPMNYYIKGEAQERPIDLDKYIYS